MILDFEIIDQWVVMGMGMMMWNVLVMFGVCIVGVFVFGFVFFLVLLFMGVVVFIGKKYMDGVCLFKRFESNVKLFVFEFFNVVLVGMLILCVYQKIQVYVD